MNKEKKRIAHDSAMRGSTATPFSGAVATGNFPSKRADYLYQAATIAAALLILMSL